MSTLDSDQFRQYLPLLEVEPVIISPIVTVMVMCIVYGFYVALFSLFILVLRSKWCRNLYVWPTVILFVISTGTIAVETMKVLRQSVAEFTSAKTQDFLPLYNFAKHDTFKTIIYAAYSILPIVANIAADFILIHRCYIVWESKRQVLVPLVFASFAVNVISGTGAIMLIVGSRDTSIGSNLVLTNKGMNILAIAMIISAAFNSVLTLLTAGRIWQITRCVRSSRTHVLTTMNKIILESGILYPLAMAVHLSIMNSTPAGHAPHVDSLPLVVLAAGIAPTFIIVRLRLGVGSSGDGTVTRPPRSSLFLNSIPQPTQMALYLPRLSTVGRHSSLVVGAHTKSLPRALQAVHV